MVYLESHSTDPYFNLALEEYIFEHMDRSRQYFLLWQNDRTIVVGKYQNTVEEINQSYVEAHGIRVARRLSGGGAVYHDKGNLNFTFIVDQADNADFNFNVFVVPVLRTLERFGVTAAFNGRNDLTIDGQKFSGNSQYARHGRLLHHGCIMLDSNLTNVADALKVKQAKFDSKSVKSVRSRVTTINAHAPRPISMEEFKAALRAGILESDGLEPRTLTPEELAAVKRLRDEKYAHGSGITAVLPLTTCAVSGNSARDWSPSSSRPRKAGSKASGFTVTFLETATLPSWKRQWYRSSWINIWKRPWKTAGSASTSTGSPPMISRKCCCTDRPHPHISPFWRI